MKSLTDADSALITMSKTMEKVTEEMNHLAVSAGMAHHAMDQDFTQQFANWHWTVNAFIDTLPFNTSNRRRKSSAGGPYFAGMESDVLSGDRSGDSRARATGRAVDSRPPLPPSMRVRKYSGMGGPTDLFPHIGAEFTTGYFMQGLLKHATPDMLEGMGKLHAHLQGSREMLPEEFRHFYRQARTATDEEGNPAYSREFLRRMVAAREMARRKHEAADTHQTGLRMRGKYGNQEVARSLAQHKQTKQIQDSTDALDKFKKMLTGEDWTGVRLGKSALQYGGMALEAASPDAFATLTGSFKLLSAVMGKELVPYAGATSRKLQYLAKKLEKTDKSTKAWIKLVAAIGAASAGLLIISPQLVAFAKLMSTLGVGTALRGLGRFAFMTPYGGAATAGIAAGASAGFAARYARDKWNERIRDLALYGKENPAALLTSNELRQTKTYEEMKKDHFKPKGKDESEKDYFWRMTKDSEFVTGVQNYHKGKYLSNRAALAKLMGHDQYDDSFFGNIKGNSKALWNMTLNNPEMSHYLQEMEKHRTKYHEVVNAKTLVQLGDEDYEKTQRANHPEYRKKHNAQIETAASLLTSLQNRIQPAYYGVEDMYKRIQLSALSESPLDQEIRRIQQESWDELVKSNGYLKSIDEKLGISQGLR